MLACVRAKIRLTLSMKEAVALFRSCDADNLATRRGHGSLFALICELERPKRLSLVNRCAKAVFNVDCSASGKGAPLG